MTVEEMKDRMSYNEFNNWILYFEAQERERKRAENKANNVIDFTDPEFASKQMVQMFKE